MVLVAIPILNEKYLCVTENKLSSAQKITEKALGKQSVSNLRWSRKFDFKTIFKDETKITKRKKIYYLRHLSDSCTLVSEKSGYLLYTLQSRIIFFFF